MNIDYQQWMRCKPWIEASLKKTPLPETMESIEKKLLADNYQLWPGESGAAITEIATFQDRKAMIVRYGGGTLSELLDKIEPALCVVAKSLGCELMMSEGRLGWKKPAEKRGYKFAWLTMVKEL